MCVFVDNEVKHYNYRYPSRPNGDPKKTALHRWKGGCGERGRGREREKLNGNDKINAFYRSFETTFDLKVDIRSVVYNNIIYT